MPTIGLEIMDEEDLITQRSDFDEFFLVGFLGGWSEVKLEDVSFNAVVSLFGTLRFSVASFTLD